MTPNSIEVAPGEVLIPVPSTADKATPSSIALCTSVSRVAVPLFSAMTCIPTLAI